MRRILLMCWCLSVASLVSADDQAPAGDDVVPQYADPNSDASDSSGADPPVAEPEPRYVLTLLRTSAVFETEYRNSPVPAPSSNDSFAPFAPQPTSQADTFPSFESDDFAPPGGRPQPFARSSKPAPTFNGGAMIPKVVVARTSDSMTIECAGAEIKTTEKTGYEITVTSPVVARISGTEIQAKGMSYGDGKLTFEDAHVKVTQPYTDMTMTSDKLVLEFEVGQFHLVRHDQLPSSAQPQDDGGRVPQPIPDPNAPAAFRSNS